MNTDPNEPLARLLDDVLEGRDQHSPGKKVALDAFRRARLIRRIRWKAAIAVVSIACVSLFYFSRPQPERRNELIPNVSTAIAHQSELPENQALTDEELLGSFPSNICSIVEVGDRKILVFFDPADRQKYLAD